MGKERYEFDEIFKWLLERGSRRDMAEYRNNIIDELVARGEIGQSVGTKKQEVGLLAKVDSFINLFRIEEASKPVVRKPENSTRSYLSKESTRILKEKKSLLDEKLGL